MPLLLSLLGLILLATCLILFLLYRRKKKIIDDGLQREHQDISVDIEGNENENNNIDNSQINQQENDDEQVSTDNQMIHLDDIQIQGNE